MSFNCGSAYGSHADYYRSFFGNNYPFLGYGLNNGCACSACGNLGGNAYAGYPFGSDACCGGGFAAGPGLFDSRCFIPISMEAFGCTPPSLAGFSEGIEGMRSKSLTIEELLVGDDDDDGCTNKTHDKTTEKNLQDTCEDEAAYGGCHNGAELATALSGNLLRSLIPIDSMDAHLGMKWHDGGVLVDREGTYEIRLFGNFSYSKDSYIEWHVVDGEQALCSLSVSMNAYSNEMKAFERTAVLKLKGCEHLRIYAAAEEKGELYVKPNGLSLTLKKL